MDDAKKFKVGQVPPERYPSFSGRSGSKNIGITRADTLKITTKHSFNTLNDELF